MTVTRTQVEYIITKRLGGYLARAEMTGETGEDNEYLADPIGWAMRLLGYSPASIITVTDDDLADVASGHTDALLDLAELRTIESMITNLDDVNITAGPVRSEWTALRTDLMKQLIAKRSAVSAMWGHLLSTPLDGDAAKSVRLIAL